MIKNVVFDVGDVLVDFRYRDYMRDLGMDEETVDFLSENIILTEFWHEMDLGIKTNDDGLRYFTEKYPERKEDIERFWEDPSEIVREYDYAPGLIQSLKDKGYMVYILSNYPVEISELHWPKFKFLPLADGYIISGYENITKPDAEIYKLLESRFGIKLEESLFIDDRQVNIDGAEAVGMTGHLFTSYEEIVETIDKLPDLSEEAGKSADEKKKKSELKKQLKQELKEKLKTGVLVDVACPDCGAKHRIYVDKTPGHCYYCGRLLKYNKQTRRIEPGPGQEKDIIQTQYEYLRRQTLGGK